MENVIDEQPQMHQARPIWPVCFQEIEHAGLAQEARIEDFMLGQFDEEYLSEEPPESDWSDWFPPPPSLTNEELDALIEWTEAEAEKHNLLSDPDLYPISDYLQGESQWIFLP